MWHWGGGIHPNVALGKPGRARAGYGCGQRGLWDVSDGPTRVRATRAPPDGRDPGMGQRDWGNWPGSGGGGTGRAAGGATRGAAGGSGGCASGGWGGGRGIAWGGAGLASRPGRCSGRARRKGGASFRRDLGSEVSPLEPSYDSLQLGEVEASAPLDHPYPQLDPSLIFKVPGRPGRGQVRGSHSREEAIS
jgi:hypothetical protein